MTLSIRDRITCISTKIKTLLMTTTGLYWVMYKPMGICEASKSLHFKTRITYIFSDKMILSHTHFGPQQIKNITNVHSHYCNFNLVESKWLIHYVSKHKFYEAKWFCKCTIFTHTCIQMYPLTIHVFKSNLINFPLSLLHDMLYY